MIAMGQLNELFHSPTNAVCDCTGGRENDVDDAGKIILSLLFAYITSDDFAAIRRQLSLIPAGHGEVARDLVISMANIHTHTHTY